MATRHFAQRPTPREAAAQKPSFSTRPHDSTELNAEYAKDILTQYRRYVTTTLEPEIERARTEASELRYDLELAREEQTTTAAKLEDAVAEIELLNERLKRRDKEFERRVQATEEQHDDHMRSVKLAAAAELTMANARIAELQRELDRARAAPPDSEATVKLAAVSEELSAANAVVASLRSRCEQLELRARQLESDVLATAGLRSVNAECLTQVHDIATAAVDYSVGLRTAFDHIQCAAPEIGRVSDAWRRVVGDCTGENALEALISLRRVLKEEHSATAAALKQIIVKHTAVLEATAASDHERHQERDLARRRLAELEDDIRAEREAMMAALEREKVKNRLAGASADVAASQTVPRSSVVTSGRPASTMTVWCQTGPELMSTAGDSDQAARLMEEVFSLHGQLAHHRETIQLLEQQRRLFMDFVDDECVTAAVQEVMSGGAAAEDFMLRGL